MILYDLSVHCARCKRIVRDHLFQSEDEFAFGKKSYTCENCQKELEENGVEPSDAFVYTFLVVFDSIVARDELTDWYTWMRKDWDNPEIADAYFADRENPNKKPLEVIAGELYIIPEAELPHLGCWLPFPLSNHLLSFPPSSSSYTGEKEGKEMFVDQEYGLTFQDRHHKEIYLRLRRKLGEINKASLSSLYVLAVIGKSVDQYITFGNIDWPRLMKVSSAWSSEEKAMVYISHELFNGGPNKKQGLHEILGSLNETWFLTALQGLRMRYI